MFLGPAEFLGPVQLLTFFVFLVPVWSQSSSRMRVSTGVRLSSTAWRSPLNEAGSQWKVRTLNAPPVCLFTAVGVSERLSALQMFKPAGVCVFLLSAVTLNTSLLVSCRHRHSRFPIMLSSCLLQVSLTLSRSRRTWPRSPTFPSTSPAPPSAPPSPWRCCGGWGGSRRASPDRPPPSFTSKVRKSSAFKCVCSLTTGCLTDRKALMKDCVLLHYGKCRIQRWISPPGFNLSQEQVLKLCKVT